MIERFFFGVIDCLEFLFKALCVIAMIWIAAIIVISILVYGIGWWMLPYILIIPAFWGIFNLLIIL